MPHGGPCQVGHCRGLEEEHGSMGLPTVAHFVGRALPFCGASGCSREKHALGVWVTCRGQVLWHWTSLGFHPGTALSALLGLSILLLLGQHGAPSQAWGWDSPGRTSHQGLVSPCRFLQGPSRAWGPSSRAYTCRRTSCRPCLPCPVSASWSSSTSAAIPSTVTASCSHFTGEHPNLDPQPGAPNCSQSSLHSPWSAKSAPAEHLRRVRVLPGSAALPGGANHPRCFGWASLSFYSLVHKVGMKSAQASGVGPSVHGHFT